MISFYIISKRFFLEREKVFDRSSVSITKRENDFSVLIL